MVRPLWIHPVDGIDLGTTSAAAAVWDVKLGGVRVSLDEHRKNTVPTSVVWTEDDERVIGKWPIDYWGVSHVTSNETLEGVRAAGPGRETSHTTGHHQGSRRSLR